MKKFFLNKASRPLFDPVVLFQLDSSAPVPFQEVFRVSLTISILPNSEKKSQVPSTHITEKKNTNYRK